MPDRNLAQCEEWLKERLLLFHLGDIGQSQKILKLKPLSELLLGVWLCRGAFSEGFVDVVVKEAWEQCEKGDLIYRILIAKPDLYRIVTTMFLFSQFGYRNERVNRILSSIRSMKVFGAVEADAWVDISTDYAYARIFGTIEDESLYCKSYLFKMPEPWVVSDQSIYAITHAVFYATSFGERDGFIHVAVKDYLETWLPVWMEKYREEGNLDLLGELCLVAAYINYQQIGQKYVDVIRDRQELNGSIRGPEHAGRQFAATLGSSGATEEFYRDYHTTIVAACTFAKYS